MSKPFDATLKHLVEAYPEHWLHALGYACLGTVQSVDADISTVSGAADKVLRINDPEPWLLHLELQGGWEGMLPRRLLRCNVLLDERHQLPVQSVVILLRPEAEARNLTGQWRRQPPHGRGGVVWRFEVVRLRLLPVAALLTGGLGTLPLAPLANVEEPQLPGVIREMEARIEAEAPAELADDLWVSTYILMGLRYSESLAASLLSGVRAMKESSTYQAILAEGREEGREEGRAEQARRMVLLIGERRLGSAGPAVRAALDAETDQQSFERMAARILEVESWEEFLAS